MKITEAWNGMAPVYINTDSCMQTFYYTLLNMLQLDNAKHILEVACGTGRLLHHAAQLKPQTTTYLATDLCQTMIDLSKASLKTNLYKLGVKNSL